MERESVLRALFERAKASDEFEFVCTLLKVRGLQAAGWDSSEESAQLTEQLIAIINAPIVSTLQTRLLLLLYAHVTEMEELYSVPANLLRICRGERYSMAPFALLRNAQGNIPHVPYTKAKAVAELADSLGFPSLAECYRHFLVRQVRNAFFHSSYTLHENEFRITDGQGVVIDGTLTHVVPLPWLFERIESALNRSLEIPDLIREHRLSYKANRVVMGRMGPNEQPIAIELTVKEGCLVGFHSPPTSGAPPT